MTKKAGTTITLVVLGIMGYVIYGSMARVQKECNVCVEFNGRRVCAKGAGATVDEARKGAVTADCGQLASGMDEVIRCQNVPPATITCT